VLLKILWKGMNTVPTNEKKGITVKIDAELHAEVKQYIESHGITMGEFIAQALYDELHPKINMREDKNMGNMRMLAFQVPEELFQRIKEHLQETGMTQKKFMLGLIERELDQNLSQRVESSEVSQEHEESAESRLEAVSEEYTEEQSSADVSENFDNMNDESENINEDQEQDESEYMGMGMSM